MNERRREEGEVEMKEVVLEEWGGRGRGGVDEWRGRGGRGKKIILP